MAAAIMSFQLNAPWLFGVVWHSPRGMGPRDGWMRRILADVWNLDLKVVEADFTLVGVNPALDRFTDLARQLRQEAEEQARRHGRELGAAVAIAPPKAA